MSLKQWDHPYAMQWEWPSSCLSEDRLLLYNVIYIYICYITIYISAMKSCLSLSPACSNITSPSWSPLNNNRKQSLHGCGAILPHFLLAIYHCHLAAWLYLYISLRSPVLLCFFVRCVSMGCDQDDLVIIGWTLRRQWSPRASLKKKLKSTQSVL